MYMRRIYIFAGHIFAHDEAYRYGQRCNFIACLLRAYRILVRAYGYSGRAYEFYKSAYLKFLRS